MKMACKYCGIVDKPHDCPHKKRYSSKKRTDNKIYKTARWQELRADILDDYNNICLWSLYVDGDVVVADTVHHIVEVSASPYLAFEKENLIPVEFYTHKAIHELYKKDKKQIQRLLRMMCSDYKNGDFTLGKYKSYIS